MTDPLSEWTRSIPTPGEIERFDEDECLAGFMDYRPGDPEPGRNRTDAFWWGWWCRRNPRPDDVDSSAVRVYWAMRDYIRHKRMGGEA